MVIKNRLKVLIAEKEIREHRRLPYHVIHEETGVAVSTITEYAKQRIRRFDASTIEAFCIFFDCQPGDIIFFTKPEFHTRGNK